MFGEGGRIGNWKYCLCSHLRAHLCNRWFLNFHSLIGNRCDTVEAPSSGLSVGKVPWRSKPTFAYLEATNFRG